MGDTARINVEHRRASASGQAPGNSLRGTGWLQEPHTWLPSAWLMRSLSSGLASKTEGYRGRPVAAKVI